MPKETMKCKVCGKEYIACRTPNLTGIFRWRDVACSVECGQVWLERIEKSRSKVNQEPVADPVQEPLQEHEQELLPEVILNTVQEVCLLDYTASDKNIPT